MFLQHIGPSSINSSLFEILYRRILPLYIFIAKVDATDRAALSSKWAEILETFSVRMGMRWRKAKYSLCWMQRTTVSRLMQHKQNLIWRMAANTSKRLSLHSKKLVSTDYYDQAVNTFTAAEVELDQAQTNLWLHYVSCSIRWRGIDGVW